MTVCPIKTCFTATASDIKAPELLHTHLPGERSEGGAGIRSPGDNEQQDDDERDLGHLPLTLHLMQPPHRVPGSLTVDLGYGSVVQTGVVRKTVHSCSSFCARLNINQPVVPCHRCCHSPSSATCE